jgi:transposase-like protein
VKSQIGEMDIKVPRDTNGEFEPVIVKKHERRINPSVDEMIISMYAKGMSTHDIEKHMNGIYGLEMSAETISHITDKVLPVAKEWQNRPLEEFYPIIYLDGMVFNVQQDGQVAKKTVYVVTAVHIDGKRDVLGIWLGEAESAKFWMKVLVDMKNRGVRDILIASVDGLKGFVEAIEAVFPQTEVQKCVVHQIRTSTRFVNYKDRKAFCNDMKAIYTAPNEQAGLEALEAFESKWEHKYQYAVKSWRANWQSLATMYEYPDSIRKMIYTTNPIESFNRVVRKVAKTKGSFPTDDSVLKLIYLIVMDTQDRTLKANRD